MKGTVSYFQNLPVSSKELHGQRGQHRRTIPPGKSM